MYASVAALGMSRAIGEFVVIPIATWERLTQIDLTSVSSIRVLGLLVMTEGKFISYLRVSTDKQGKSGLGIEAQRQAVERYLNGGRWTVAAEYVETESSRRSDRPKLAAALAHVKAKLVFAKLLVPRTIAQPGRSKGRSNHTCQSRRRIKLPGWL